MIALPFEPTDSPEARAKLVDHFSDLARQRRWSRGEREEFRRLACAWARTLHDQRPRARHLYLDEQQG
jgi:hypothetical protein